MAKLSLQDELQDYIALFVALKDTIDEMPHDLLMKRPEQDKWSIKELVCHLLDTELVTAARMKTVIAEDNPTLQAFDQDKWSEKLNYMEWDMKETLLLFGLSRSAMAGILRNLPAAAWKRTGQHTEKGPVTLRSLLEETNHHCKHHLAQIVANKMKLEG
jgi:hypothetical protein